MNQPYNKPSIVGTQPFADASKAPTVEACSGMNWHDYFTYDEATGSLIWKPRPSWMFPDTRSWATFNSRSAGKVAGTLGADGYIEVGRRQFRVKAHRVIIEMTDGMPLAPGEQVDHIDGVRSNNKRGNLRRCTPSQNSMNSRAKKSISGLKWARWYKPYGKYLSEVQKNGKRYFLGYFDTAQEAHDVAAEKAKELHGQFFRP